MLTLKIVTQKAKRHIDSLRTTINVYQIGKRQAMMAYMDSD